MSSNGGEDAVDGTIEKKDEDALVESVKKVEISDNSKEVEKKASTEEPGHFHFTNCSPYNTCTQIRQFWKATFPTTSSHSQPFIFPDKALLKSQFVLFSKFGDKASDGETIKLSQSDKWFKQVLINLIILMIDVGQSWGVYMKRKQAHDGKLLFNHIGFHTHTQLHRLG